MNFDGASASDVAVAAEGLLEMITPEIMELLEKENPLLAQCFKDFSKITGWLPRLCDDGQKFFVALIADILAIRFVGLRHEPIVDVSFPENFTGALTKIITMLKAISKKVECLDNYSALQILNGKAEETSAAEGGGRKRKNKESPQAEEEDGKQEVIAQEVEQKAGPPAGDAPSQESSKSVAQ